MLHVKKIPYLFLFIFSVFTVNTSMYAQVADTVKVEEDVAAADTVAATVDTVVSQATKGDFKEIDEHSIAAIQQRTIKDTVLHQLKNDEDFWYANEVAKEKEKKENFWEWFYRITGKRITKIIVWCFLIALVLAIIILYLRDNNIGLFATASKKIQHDVDDKAMPENIFEIDYEAAISKAFAANNYRLATRFLFLRLLKTLSSHNIIEYASDKTNFDYLFQISGTKYYTSFIAAAKNYEYLWYGNFEVNHEQFNSIKKGFDDFEKQLA